MIVDGTESRRKKESKKNLGLTVALAIQFRRKVPNTQQGVLSCCATTAPMYLHLKQESALNGGEAEACALKRSR